MPDENNIRPWAWLLRKFYEGKSKGESLVKSTEVHEKFTAVDVFCFCFLMHFREGLHLRNLLVSVESFIVPFWPKMQVQGLFHADKNKNSVGNTERL